MIDKLNKKRIFLKNLQSKFFLKANPYKLKANKAFVSMIALLLANVFLVIGLSVFNIALREIVLSSGARDSLFAFYAADSGMECALYWDIRMNAFSTDTASGNINCSEQTVGVVFTGCGVDCSRNTFNLNYSTGACVSVEVNKLPDDKTLIKSFGKNSCDVNNLRRVERAWQVSY